MRVLFILGLTFAAAADDSSVVNAEENADLEMDSFWSYKVHDDLLDCRNARSCRV